MYLLGRRDEEPDWMGCPASKACTTTRGELLIFVDLLIASGLGERVKVKDFMADYLGSNRAWEIKLSIAATVAGVAAITSSLSIMVALAVTWVAAVNWNAARTARNALFPTT
ncbi:hypothetical protein FRC04_004320 [Tulasnella sp. 424]|nr:hypothetical protein FRC04_004320 [Tulasnella sp. 424]